MPLLPSLSWKPTVFSARQPMTLEASRPYVSREAALSAIDAWQRAHGPTSVFVVTPTDAGWVTSRYSENQLTVADLPELELSGPRLHPQTFIVDARGRVAGLDLRAVPRDQFQATAVPTVGTRVLPMIPATAQVNHGRNVAWNPKIAFQPGRDIEQLADVMKWISTQLPPGTKVKAGGSRHAWSPAAATDSVYIQPERMGFIEPPSAIDALRADVSTRHLMRVGSGTTIKELNADLWARGLAMPALGGYDGQTIGGVLPTGTHGSVLGRGPLSDGVRSVDLVKPNGDKVRIEPAGGPTDPAQFRATHPGWTLIQDDDTFDASLINLGTMGVVHSYLLEVTDKFYLNEVRTRTTGAKAEAILAGGNVYNLVDNPEARPTTRTFAGQPTPAFHLELLWNPHSDQMVVTSRQKVSPRRQAELSAHEPDDFTRPTRDLIRTLTADGRYSRPVINNVFTELLTDVVGPLHSVLRKIAPEATSGLVDAALDALADGEYTQRSYNVFNVGDGANLLPAQSATLSVPMRGDEYLEAMGIIRDVAAKFSAEHHQWQTGPISMRFVKASRAMLGDPEDSCKFELIFSGNAPEDQRLAKALTDAYYVALEQRFGADVRFHWGQLPPESGQGHATLAAAYPRFDAFNRIRAQFDPTGRMMNAWQEKMFVG